ncbi:MAG: DUF4349 domain-containing protein [Thermofilaceae archaeon]
MRKPRLRWIAVLLSALGIFILGICVGQLLPGGFGVTAQTSAPIALPTGNERYSTLASKGASESLGSGGSGVSYSIPEGRKVILEGFVRLRVGEGAVKRVAEELAGAALMLGGYVGETNVREDGGYAVLRVPSERFDEALEEVKKLGEVVELRTFARDVTEDYVDLKARLNASLALEQRLLQMLERAKNVEEMLKVEEYLWRVRAQIEVYTAQLKNLERMIEYSTIYVYIEAPPKEVKPIIQFPTFDPTPAVANALSLLFSIVYAIITALIGLSPLAIVGAAGFLGYKRMRKGNAEKERVKPSG